MEKYYIGGKAFYPEEDILLCDTQNYDLLAGFGITEEYLKIYVTKKREYYQVSFVSKREYVTVISEDEAKQLLDENAPYILTDNYDEVFGRPERG